MRDTNPGWTRRNVVHIYAGENYPQHPSASHRNHSLD